MNQYELYEDKEGHREKGCSFTFPDVAWEGTGLVAGGKERPGSTLD